jgi:hypothetical protein
MGVGVLEMVFGCGFKCGCGAFDPSHEGYVAPARG